MNLIWGRGQKSEVLLLSNSPAFACVPVGYFQSYLVVGVGQEFDGLWKATLLNSLILSIVMYCSLYRNVGVTINNLLNFSVKQFEVFT